MTYRSLRRRFSEHVSNAVNTNSQSRFYRAIRKYGRHSFRIELIFEVKTREEAIEAEILLIREMRPFYNSTIGGEGAFGHLMSIDGRKKIIALHTGNRYRLGKTHSAETRKRLSEIGKTQTETWKKYAALGPKASSRIVISSDGNMFPSASEAARYYKISKSMIIEICNGNPRRKSASGMSFRYSDTGNNAEAD